MAVYEGILIFYLSGNLLLHHLFERTHGAPYRGYGYVPLRFGRNVPGRVAQSVGHMTRKSGVLGSIPGLATYFRFSFRFFKKGSCQLLAKVCARSTG